ncbi:MAG: cytochrome C oxidase subunit IV family protein [Paracoccus sp. (in: a-proteobacteria)]
MRKPGLTRAWGLLIGLSLIATALAMSLGALPSIWRELVALVILAISGVKANLILAVYLELRLAPAVLRGFRVLLALFLTLAAALYLAA